MPCPNDRRARSVTVAFRMTPAQSRWLDEVVAESGMTKQDFIMARLREDGITVAVSYTHLTLPTTSRV